MRTVGAVMVLFAGSANLSCGGGSDDSGHAAGGAALDAGFSGTWVGPSTVMFAGVEPLASTGVLVLAVSGHTAVVTLVCSDGSGSITATGSGTSATWQGTVSCPGTPIGTCPNVAVTYTSASFTLANGALSAQGVGTASGCGVTRNVTVAFTGQRESGPSPSPPAPPSPPPSPLPTPTPAPSPTATPTPSPSPAPTVSPAPSGPTVGRGDAKWSAALPASVSGTPIAVGGDGAQRIFALVDTLLVRLDPSGASREWTLNLGAWGSALAVTAEGDAVVALCGSPGCDAGAVRILRIAPDGRVRWDVAFSGMRVSALDTHSSRTLALIDDRAVILDASGAVTLDTQLGAVAVAFGGTSGDFVAAYANGRVERITPTGAVRWGMPLVRDAARVNLHGIDFAANGSIAVTGMRYTASDATARVAPVVTVTGGDGSWQWQADLAPEADCCSRGTQPGRTVEFGRDNDVVVQTSGDIARLQVFTRDGSKVWERTFQATGTSSADGPRIGPVAVGASGDIIVGASASGSGAAPEGWVTYPRGTTYVVLVEP